MFSRPLEDCIFPGPWLRASLAVGPLDIYHSCTSFKISEHLSRTDLDMISSQLTVFYEVVAKKTFTHGQILKMSDTKCYFFGIFEFFWESFCHI